MFAFLILVTSAIQLLILNLNYTRDRKRLENLQTSAKLVAWGPRFRSIEAGLKNDNLALYNKNVIVANEKRVRVPLSGSDMPPLPELKQGEDEKAYWDADERLIRKIMAKRTSNSDSETPRRFIDALVTKEGVSVMDPSTKEWIPLDESAAPKPTAKSTWPFSLASTIAAKLGLGQQGSTPSVAIDENQAASSSDPVVSNGGKKKNKKKQ